MALQKSVNPAAIYESFFVPAIFRPLSQLVLSAARLRPGEHVLDVACGTGIVARQAAPAVGSSGRVAAIDLRPGMLAVARSLLASDGPAIDWQEGDAHALPFTDASFDVIVCQQGLQFFTRPEHALREMKRVSRPGGRVVLACWRELELQGFMKTLSELEFAHLSITGLSREDAIAPFSLQSPAELTRLCTAAGLEDVEVSAESVETTYPAENFIHDMEYAYVAVMPEFAEDPGKFDAYVELIEQETEALRAEHTKDGKISFPMQTHLVKARA